ncbi:MAG: low molecular weight protein tyrosine phosphatase family protein [Alphaproteobacteria bacterium]
MKNILFVCSQNRLRSPTAEQVFSGRPDLEVSSAGTNNDAENPLTSELIKWADVIVVMEKMHRTKVQKRFRSSLNGKRMICLDIPDEFVFMDPALVALLEERLARHLPTG